MSTQTDSHEQTFARHRPLLFTVAYELLGSAADAEDVVQETWLRWAGVDLTEVRDRRAYLVRIITRQGLNRLRTLARRREDYVGPWLPEPLLTSPDVADDVLLAESVSTAMLLVLETLSPHERVVFVLHDVFDVPFSEIASALDRTPAAVRQTAHRARAHVRARQPRVGVEAGDHDRVTERFLRAASTGDLASLLDVLAPDVVLHTDGGGLVKAALQPIAGVDKVLRFLDGVNHGGFRFGLLSVNGTAAIGVSGTHGVEAVITWRTDESSVTELYVQRNPEKLIALQGVPYALERTTGPVR